MEKTVLQNMFDNLLHIGNKTNFWNTKMRPYIYGSVNGIHVINLIKTYEKLEEVKKELFELTSSGKKVLIVATKIQSKDAFKALAEETGSYYVCEKWIPGLLTNFDTIKKRISSYLKLLSDFQNGAFNVLTKKERASKMLELEKLNKAYSGLKEMKKLPDAILVSDGIYERQALREAQILNIKSFAIFNTNGDIDLAYNIIPANTNSVKSYSYLVSELKSAFASKAPTSGKAVVKKMEEKKPVVKKIEEKKSTSKKSSSKTEEKSNKVEDRNVKVEEKVGKTKRTRSKKEEVKKEETA